MFEDLCEHAMEIVNTDPKLAGALVVTQWTAATHVVGLSYEESNQKLMGMAALAVTNTNRSARDRSNTIELVHALVLDLSGETLNLETWAGDFS